MKLSPQESQKQLQAWRNHPFRHLPPAMHDEAERTALRAIGRESLMAIAIDERLIGTTDEEREVYEDICDAVLRALMNEEPFTP